MKIEHKYLVWLLTGAALILGITFTYAVHFDTFGYGIVKAAVGITLFFATERFIMRTIVGENELKKGNVAYAIFFLGFALIIGLAMATG